MTHDSLIVIGIALAFLGFGLVIAWSDHATRAARSTWDNMRK